MSAPLRIALQAVLVTALVYVLGVLVLVLTGTPLPDAFGGGVTEVLLFVDIAIVTWIVLLVVGAVRGRGIGWGLRGSFLAAVVGALVNLFWIVVLSLINGGIDPVALLLGARGGLFLLVAVVAVGPLVRTK